MANIHFILQGKGGVGKSVSAWVLSQFLLDRAASLYWADKSPAQQKEDSGSMADLSYWETPEAPAGSEFNPVIIDIDPLNATLSEFKALHPRRFDLFIPTDDPYDRYHLRQEVFDEMMDLIFNSPTDVIVDVGSAGFAPFCHYLLENNALKHIIESACKNKHRAYIHSVIAGGDNFSVTVSSFADLARQIPLQQNPADASSPEVKFMVWLNPYFGKVTFDKMSFEDTDAYLENKNRIAGIIRMPNTRRSELFDQAMSMCLENRWTFREFIRAGNSQSKNKPKISTMAVSRIVDIRDQYYRELEAMREI